MARPALADSPSVTAVLTSSETIVGQPVQLQVKVSGSSGVTPPGKIAVDGLDIRFSGQSQMLEGRNLQFNYSFTYNYTVMPLRAGAFTIPPLTFQVAGKPLKTPELKLDVVNASGATRRGQRSAPQQQQGIDEKQIAFAELVVTKKTAYVGEMVPVEIRLGFHARVPSRLTSPPEISGQGFTAQKMPEAQQKIETIDGIPYHVLTFKTALAAARTGKFDVGPVAAKALVQLPRRFGPSRSPFDLFNMDDPFSDPFFRDAFDLRGEQREIEVKSEGATLEVKPLPPNPPPGFSGAVGSFTMTADANPKAAQVGDPLTVTMNISGRGNFDRVGSPVLESEEGWHKYPPSSKFQQDDDIGISGTKTFETVLAPNERKQVVPPLLFAYFDPAKEKYVSLRSDPIAIRLEGGSPPAAGAAPTATVGKEASSSPPPSAAPTAAAKPQDILYQLTDKPTWQDSFAPPWTRNAFWYSQALPLFLAAAFIGLKRRQKRAGDREAQRLAALIHEAAQVERELHRGSESSSAYLSQAARLVQLKTALAKQIDPNRVDADTAAAAFRLDDARRTQLRELFRLSDELKYSGFQNGNGVAVAHASRQQVLDLVEHLRA